MTNGDYSSQKNTSRNAHLWNYMKERLERKTIKESARTEDKSSSVSGIPFILALSFLSLHPLCLLPWRGNSSCMQVISVCSDGHSALIGWLYSYADVKITGCVCQKATLLVVVTSWRQMSLTGHAHSAKPEIYIIFSPLYLRNRQINCNNCNNTVPTLS